MTALRRWRLIGAEPALWKSIGGLSALLALSGGLLHTVNALPVLGAGALLMRFGEIALILICGYLPAIAIIVAVDRRLKPAGPLRWLCLAALALTAAAVGAAGNATAAALYESIYFETSFREIVFWQLSSLLTLTLLVVAVREGARQRRAAGDALHAARLRDIALRGQVAEARLQMLRAQVEPHFLFNSLANVRRLTRTDPNAGALLLADLLCYFRATLPRLREDAATLTRESEFARAFLAVHQVRMGSRLDVEFMVEEGLGDTPVPPMMLLTLIENALKHGLAPLPEGGRIRIEARGEAGAVRLSVSDNGAGLGSGHGGGTGLANIRARLRSLYGPAAQLTLRTNEPRGVIASILLPAAP